MLPLRAPIITPGQIYLNAELNEYLIVTASRRGQVHYQGPGFRGFSEDHSFIERFQPVDPADVSAEELSTLLKFCESGTKPLIGFIASEA